jgi:predicted RNA-binding Zn-ribbon protein involved in translation (DUF1610 family)
MKDRDTRHRTPLWVYGGHKPAPDDFKSSPKRNCIGHGLLFFSDDLSDQAAAKNLCATCPLFRLCTRWTLENLEVEAQEGGFEGIFAGMNGDWRRRIYYGLENYWDWRKAHNHARNAAKAAARKREQAGERKRDHRYAELEDCPRCGNREDVMREGRDRITDRQVYRCMDCGHRFQGELL